MNESFDKFFRNPDAGIKIRNQGSFKDEELEEIRKDFVSEIIARYNKRTENVLSLETELGEAIKAKITFLLEVATEYFSSLGFSDVKFNPFHLVTGDLSTMTGASNRLNGISVLNTDVSDREIKQLVFLKILGHELYHATAAVSLTIKDSFLSQYHLDRYVHTEEGASYTQEDTDKLSALEEGLASRFELLMFEKIKSVFPPDIIDRYDHLVSEIIHSNYVNNTSDPIDVALHSFNDGYVTFGTSKYKAPRELVNFLASRIDNFDRLVEDARLKRHPLALARAIENEFGEGSYRRITTAEVDTSYALIAELSSK